jgi:hypothetical protein
MFYSPLSLSAKEPLCPEESSFFGTPPLAKMGGQWQKDEQKEV